ncbi:MAG: aldo/keto reductase [Anaerolineae bacterium]|nr:aldo/keto reductase [Anaerolineae bacterium]
MEYRYLGKTGLKVSALCLGSMQFGWTADEAASLHILDVAWQNGVNFIDTADIYSRWAEGNPGGISEEIIGKWIKRSATPRHQLILATKVRGRMGEAPNDEGLSRLHIMHSVEASLKRLQTDVIDLYQVHWFDAQTPIEETLRVLDDLIHQGKVRYIGCSNYPAWRLMQALWASDRLNLHTFVSVQPHYNLVHRAEFENELAEVCAWYGLGVIPYSPLAGGFLSGKYQPGKMDINSARARSISQKYDNPKSWAILNTLKEIADEKQCSLSQIALAWLLHTPVVTSPIIGPRSVEQLIDNLSALEVHLDAEEVQRLNAISDWKS